MSKVKVKAFEAEEVIVEEGQPSNDVMYFLLQGAARVEKVLQGTKTEINTMSTGDFFGEMALVMNHARTASVTAISPVKLAVFDRSSFLEELGKNVNFTFKLFMAIVARMARVEKAISESKAHIMVNLDLNFPDVVSSLRMRNQEIIELITSAHQKFANPAKPVFKAGSKSDGKVYAVIKGEIQLLMQKGDEQEMFMQLLPGDFFGISPAYTESDYLYSAVAKKSETKLVGLEKEMFTRTIKANPDFFFNLFKSMVWRLHAVEVALSQASETTSVEE